MKKLIATMVSSLLTFSIAATPLFAQGKSESASGMEKKETMMEKKEATGPGMMGKVKMKKSEYVLPYPGILPDHPLYALKKLRDGILDKLIVDPIRKAEFYILQSDKHLNMTVFLLDKGNAALAGGTSQSAEQFMEKAVKIFTKLKAEGKEIPTYVLEKLTNSIQKHIEVLTELVEKAQGKHKEGLTKLLERATLLWEEVEKLK